MFANKTKTRVKTYENRALLGGLLGSGLIKDGNPLSVHFVMFVPTILGQGTLDQQGEWLGRAWNLEILGTYAQVNQFLFAFLLQLCETNSIFQLVNSVDRTGSWHIYSRAGDAGNI